VTKSSESYNLIFSGYQEDSAETIRRVKSALVADLELSVPEVQRIISSFPSIVTSSEKKKDLSKALKILKAAGALVEIQVASDLEKNKAQDSIDDSDESFTFELDLADLNSSVSKEKTTKIWELQVAEEDLQELVDRSNEPKFISDPLEDIVKKQEFLSTEDSDKETVSLSFDQEVKLENSDINSVSQESQNRDVINLSNELDPDDLQLIFDDEVSTNLELKDTSAIPPETLKITQEEVSEELGIETSNKEITSLEIRNTVEDIEQEKNTEFIADSDNYFINPSLDEEFKANPEIKETPIEPQQELAKKPEKIISVDTFVKPNSNIRKGFQKKSRNLGSDSITPEAIERLTTQTGKKSGRKDFIILILAIVTSFGLGNFIFINFIDTEDSPTISVTIAKTEKRSKKNKPSVLANTEKIEIDEVEVEKLSPSVMSTYYSIKARCNASLNGILSCEIDGSTPAPQELSVREIGQGKIPAPWLTRFVTDKLKFYFGKNKNIREVKDTVRLSISYNGAQHRVIAPIKLIADSEKREIRLEISKDLTPGPLNFFEIKPSDDNGFAISLHALIPY
jgi:hypothetical protein